MVNTQRIWNIALVVAVGVFGFTLGQAITNTYAQNVTVPAPVVQQTLTQVIQANIQSLAALISGLVALAVAVGKWIDTLRAKGVIDKRWDKAIELYHKGVSSLEATDTAFKDNMVIFNKFASSLAKSKSLEEWYQKPENQKLLDEIKQFQDDTTQELKEYYDVISPQPGANSSDSKIKDMAAVEAKLVKK
jgi:hypothetical protein